MENLKEKLEKHKWYLVDKGEEDSRIVCRLGRVYHYLRFSRDGDVGGPYTILDVEFIDEEKSVDTKLTDLYFLNKLKQNGY